jgi:hypothetical protein
MEIETTWVRAPAPKSGLDHLSAQAPCISVYAQLLPGITNVTDRARYYSLYPWLIWSFDRRFPKADAEEFEQIFRRADCLLTLIAERHARVTDQVDELHGRAMVGRNTLTNVVAQLENGGSIRLSTYATREEVENRYFKNRLGGLGQYYAGTLQDLKILGPRKGDWVRYSLDHGEKLAEAVDTAVNGDAFFALAKKDRITADDLDALKEFCPCNLSKSRKECDFLLDLFFDRTAKYGTTGQQRAKSLALLLHLADELSTKSDQDLDIATFRPAIYTGFLPKRKSWKVPTPLAESHQGWHLYQRNELLSVAVQGVFAVTLDLLQKAGIHPLNSTACARWLCGTDTALRVLKSYRKLTIGQIISQTRKQLPPLSDWLNDKHELQLARAILEGYYLVEREPHINDHVEMLQQSLQLLVALVARDEPAHAPYRDIAFPPGFLDDHPINLGTLRHWAANEWQDLTASELLEWLCVRWGIDAHLRVALRKLRSDPRPTFQVQPAETGLEVIGVPPPVRTNPRFAQAVQILIDLGALRRRGTDARLSLTELGQTLLGEIISK